MSDHIVVLDSSAPAGQVRVQNMDTGESVLVNQSSGAIAEAREQLRGAEQ